MFKYKEAFSGFSVDDLEKARSFYENILDLTVKNDPMGVLEMHVTGNRPLIIYLKEDHQPATFTILNFTVDDIEEAVDGLTKKGIRFEQYDDPIKTDEKGICRNDQGPAIAWFKDPAGNILSVLEE